MSLVYLITALAATWPLVRGLGRDVPWDLGDSILNMWILSWDGEQIRRILSGDFARIATFFDANIFHPVPLALAYSEHLIPQAVQIFPVWLISGNPILCYNLLFLSSIVLAGLGMYLLVRQLTGNALAAFIAGLLFAFAPYRLPQSGHLQVLTSQWMPFVLYGLLRVLSQRGDFFHSRGRPSRLWPRTCRRGITCFSSCRLPWRSRSGKSGASASGETDGCGWSWPPPASWSQR